MSTALAIAGVTAVLRDLLNDGLVNHNISGVLGSTVTVSVAPPDRVVPSDGTESSRCGPDLPVLLGPQRRRGRLFEHLLVAALHAAVAHTDRPDRAGRVADDLDLDVLGAADEALEEEHFKDYYVHNTGHWLGLDVHDVGEYEIDGHSRVLEPGMVLTVEPGIYIPPGSEGIDEKWQGIGIRIEDNVAVTKEDPRILTDGLVKSADEIEAFMAG